MSVDKKYISFTALLHGDPVRLTATVGDFEIVSNDNTESFNVEHFAKHLKDIEFQEVYDE